MTSPLSATRLHNTHTKRFPKFHAMLIGLLLVLVSGCGNPPFPDDIITISGETMGTTYTVRIAGSTSEHKERTLHNAIAGELQAINNLMSTYKEDSEVSRFNRAAPDTWFPVSRDTALVMAEGLAIAAETGGAFDMTVGPLVNLWGFGRESSGRKIPDREELASVRNRVGHDLIQVRRNPPALLKKKAGVQVDLSAIAKGYAVDKVAGLVENFGFSDYLVEIGGEIRARGKKGKKAWTVGVEMPVADRRLIHKILQIKNKSLATSGDYRNFFEQDGRRYSHTIDPRTGVPVNHHLTAATVISNTCMTADAWATAFMVLGYDKASALAGSRNMPVLFVLREDDGFTVKTNRHFRRLTGAR